MGTNCGIILSMIKRLLPTYYTSSIYDIDPSFYRKIGVKVILSDLDNTLDTVKTKQPSERAIELVKKLKQEGFEVYIVSNNSSTRVQTYAKLLSIGVASFMRKPLSGPLKGFLKEKGIDPKEAILIGDQLLTDVGAGNGAGVKTILCHPLSKIDPPWTRLNRILERKMRIKMNRKHLLPCWREI